jgi:ferritin
MLSKTMERALNDQVQWELYSGYLYVSMATYFEDKGLMGFANWMHVQDQEERFHAEKFYNYIVSRGGRVILQAIPAPSHDWASPLAVFEEALAHEQGVTARIYKLMDLALAEKDHGTASLLTWFIDEQVEEEANVSDVIAKLKLVDQTPGGAFLLDKDLATRVYTPPTTPAA